MRSSLLDTYSLQLQFMIQKLPFGFNTQLQACNGRLEISPEALVRSMLQAVLNKAKRWGLYGGKHPE